MLDNARLLALIERTLEADPQCPLCHAPNVVRDHNGRLWLECETAAKRPLTGFIDRLYAALQQHPRRLIVDLREERAA
jgi:hypothetical protein